jgi:predicted transposase/invertase (TIGR01784 family)
MNYRPYIQQIIEIWRPNEILPLGVYEMGQRVDVQCEDKDDNMYIIEMQAHPLAGDNLENAHRNLKTRNAHYVARAFGNQQSVKKESNYNLPYYKLHKAILINICNFNLYPDEKEFTHDVYLRRSKGDIFIDHICIIVVELLKAKKFNKNLINQLSAAEAIAFFLLFADDMNYRPYIQQIIEIWRPIKMAYDTLQQIKRHIPETKLQELRRLQYQMDIAHTKSVIYGEGVEKGRKEGRKEGREEGREEGIEKGREETKLEMAQTMIKNNEDMTFISRYTGYSIEKINQIKKSLPSNNQ